MVRLGNPFSLTPAPVTFFTVLVYVALFALLLVNHHVLPSVPSRAPTGIDLSTAWSDLKSITTNYHPYNSHANDATRQFLLHRIYAILQDNNASYAVEDGSGTIVSKADHSGAVTVINDLVSNVTTASGKTSVYFEGNNIIVSIKGTESGGHCYSEVSSSAKDKPLVKGGVLVNAHFDSVSTGFGATDDGVGVITILQLLSYFTTPGNEPKRCLVLLLNNGEEDYLNGARAFMRHPVSQTTHAFLNLEGAGAGGKAILFRSTDTEITRFYKRAKYPAGTVIIADGFQRGLIRSQTDYVVFNGELGMRGLDVAFYEPRAKYHTMQDSAIETTKQSVWHMLSASLATVEALTSDTSDEFSGRPTNGKVNAGTGSRGVYFDLFGRLFAVFELHSLFAWSVTLLVFTPVLFIVLTIFLSRVDKNYMFARRGWVHSADDDHYISFNGWRGFFRMPITVAIATAAVIAMAYLYTKLNPLIAYSSEYAVWSSMLSAWFFIAWMGLRGSDAMRPSALQRIYALIWIYAANFALIVLVTVSENNYHLSAGYPLVIYFGSVSVALFLSYLEMFALPKKADYVALMDNDTTPESRPLTSGTNGTHRQSEHEEEEQENDTTETTSLLRGGRDQSSFARYGSHRTSHNEGTAPSDDYFLPPEYRKAYGDEQPWSSKLPSSIWLLQFLLLGPINIILLGQVALQVTAGLHQTGADGSSVLTLYLMIAALSVLLFIPLTPFLHRFHFHIPTLLLLVLIGTLVYNIVAFPFSANNKLKLFFLQRVDCDTGETSISLTGVSPYVQQAVHALPSAAKTNINCTKSDTYLGSRNGLTSCIWPGLAAHPVPELAVNSSTLQARKKMMYEQTWFDFDVTRSGKKNSEATFHIRARNTRNCRIYFDTPITSLSISDAAPDTRFPTVGEDGSTELRLWSRTWDASWNVTVGWEDERASDAADATHMSYHGKNALPLTKKSKEAVLTGSVVCLYADANTQGAIPGLEEVWKFLPTWAIVTKAGDGLVEGWKKFELS